MVLDFSLFKFLIHTVFQNITLKIIFFYLFDFNILDLKSLKLFLSSKYIHIRLFKKQEPV